MAQVAIFASGEGTNAEAIIRNLHSSGPHRVAIVLTNRQNAGVIARAEVLGVPIWVIDRNRLNDPNGVLGLLEEMSIDLVVLAGFLWQIPAHIVRAFRGRIVNIHPALLPKYGGKGMYGVRVHQAVKDAGEKETGITIHHVNEKYDKGKVIIKVTCDLTPEDTVEEIADKVRQLELMMYPMVVAKMLG